MREKKIMRFFLSIILSFGLAVFLFLLSAGIVIQVGYLSKTGLQQQFAKTGYARETVRITTEKISAYLLEKGLTEEFVETIIDEDKYYREFTLYMEKALETGKVNPDSTEEMKNELRTAIYEYLSDENSYETAALGQAVEETVSECAHIYEKYLHPTFIQKYYEVSDRYASGLKLLVIVSAVGTFACALTLWLMYHYKHRAVRYMLYAVLSVTVWHGILVVLLSNPSWLDKAKVGPDVYQILVKNHISYGMGLEYLMIGFGVLAAILLRLGMKYLKKNVR